MGEKGRVRSDSDTMEPVLTEGQFRDRTNIINFKRRRLFLLLVTWSAGLRGVISLVVIYLLNHLSIATSQAIILPLILF